MRIAVLDYEHEKHAEAETERELIEEEEQMNWLITEGIAIPIDDGDEDELPEGAISSSLLEVSGLPPLQRFPSHEASPPSYEEELHAPNDKPAESIMPRLIV